ncbi:DUF6712 family protein [Parasediminibacterium paludis]|uniref:DUF6712 family protein n=1 Tax=Parasediminibacterium paludis TaxID=908966 RepID=A0ABV8PSL2_9BACT
MPLITTIEQFKSYVKLNYTSTSSATLPNMAIADETFLWPVLGEEFYTTMLTSTDANYNRLKELCRRAVAPLAMMKDLPNRQVKIGDTGLHMVSTENSMPATRWAYKELETSLANDGAKALEAVWEYLIANAATLAWANPQPYRTLFTSGKDFAYYFHLYQPHRLFAALLPVITEVEEHILYVAIGKDFAIELRDKTNPTDAEKRALMLAKHAVASLAISNACKKLSVNIGVNGFTVLMGDSGDMDFRGRNDSSYTEKQALQLQCDTDGNAWLSQLKAYLNETASNSVFTTYFNSSLYKDPAAAPVADANSSRTGFVAL